MGYAYGSSKTKYQSLNLTPCCELEVHYPTYAFKSVKGPGNTFDLGPKWQITLRPSVIFHGICIGPPANPNIKVDI
jgi:hypothetical protein